MGARLARNEADACPMPAPERDPRVVATGHAPARPSLRKVKQEILMEQRTIAEVAKQAQVFSSVETARAQRRERLERLGQLLEKRDGPGQMLTQIEYLRPAGPPLLPPARAPPTLRLPGPA